MGERQADRIYPSGHGHMTLAGHHYLLLVTHDEGAIASHSLHTWWPLLSLSGRDDSPSIRSICRHHLKPPSLEHTRSLTHYTHLSLWWQQITILILHLFVISNHHYIEREVLLHPPYLRVYWFHIIHFVLIFLLWVLVNLVSSIRLCLFSSRCKYLMLR